MKVSENYVRGSWFSGEGTEVEHVNALNGAPISFCSSKGLDYSAVLEYGRQTGGAALRKMSFQERGLMLKKLALHLTGIKDRFYAVRLPQALRASTLGSISKAASATSSPMPP